MATNQMRREAAKRKLERQQQRRVAQARRRQRVAIVASAGAVLLVVVGIVLITTLPSGGTPPAPAADPAASASATPTTTDAAAPARALGDCAFTATPNESAAKPAPVPTLTTASTQGTVAANLQTDRGPIPLTLDRSTGPCAVESFISLINAGYYNGTPCHRLTTGEGLKVLQCGDPTGSGTGGPGYTINDEPPTGLVAAPGQSGVSIYPRGTVAMAKTAAPDSGGSQFFLVYADSMLPPDYTVFGKIGDQGLATLDAIAAAGSDGSHGAGDGKPVTPVTIQTATLG